jgi:hypothetical protein
MRKHFNTAGPNVAALHYQLDPLRRFELSSVLDLIAQQRYFVLHAPRQTGKTTCLLALRDYLNSHNDYAALYVNIEGAQAARGDVAAGVRAVLAAIGSQARRVLGLLEFDSAIPGIVARQPRSLKSLAG